MKSMHILMLALVMFLGSVNTLVLADGPDPLFVNMTSDDAHRASMAIGFSKAQQGRGHPVTVFLNDKGVLVGSKANAGKYAEQQKNLSDIMGNGGVVIMCPMCMQHYGVKQTDLLPGIQVGNPELTGNALFKDDTKTLSW